MRVRYTKELLENIVPRCISMAGVLRELGLKISGGNYSHIKGVIISFGIDTSHFLGMAATRGISPAIKLTKQDFMDKYLRVLNRSASVNTHNIKLRLIAFGILEARCNNCHGEKWLGGTIPLELHHINGDRWDNRIENIELLCPNCHALTSNNSGRKNKKKIKDNDVTLSNHRNGMSHYGVGRKVERPPYKLLLKEVESMGFVAVGKKYGVSDKAVRKWIEMYQKYEMPQ